MGGDRVAGVIRDWEGNLYGTTNGGGAAGAGVVYKLNTRGQETVLYSFTGGADGATPHGGVIRDSAGNFYGTTDAGGAAVRPNSENSIRRGRPSRQRHPSEHHQTQPVRP